MQQHYVGVDSAGGGSPLAHSQSVATMRSCCHRRTPSPGPQTLERSDPGQLPASERFERVGRQPLCMLTVSGVCREAVSAR
jgi:hypothetical protein